MLGFSCVLLITGWKHLLKQQEHVSTVKDTLVTILKSFITKLIQKLFKKTFWCPGALSISIFFSDTQTWKIGGRDKDDRNEGGKINKNNKGGKRRGGGIRN